MHGRGCSKRHTVGCTDDLPAPPSTVSSPMEPPLTHSPVIGGSSGGRTRRSGLLTVTERPPGKIVWLKGEVNTINHKQ